MERRIGSALWNAELVRACYYETDSDAFAAWLGAKNSTDADWWHFHASCMWVTQLSPSPGNQNIGVMMYSCWISIPTWTYIFVYVIVRHWILLLITSRWCYTASMPKHKSCAQSAFLIFKRSRRIFIPEVGILKAVRGQYMGNTVKPIPACLIYTNFDENEMKILNKLRNWRDSHLKKNICSAMIITWNVCYACKTVGLAVYIVLPQCRISNRALPTRLSYPMTSVCRSLLTSPTSFWRRRRAAPSTQQRVAVARRPATRVCWRGRYDR